MQLSVRTHGFEAVPVPVVVSNMVRTWMETVASLAWNSASPGPSLPSMGDVERTELQERRPELSPNC